jgi:rhodanese-related sulfurtransferase
LEAIGRDALQARLARGEVVVLDVRPAAEYTAGHIAGARSLPIAELRAILDREFRPEGVEPEDLWKIEYFEVIH